MRYCGVVPAQGHVLLAMLEEVRTPEPPIRLSAIFYEAGTPEQVAAELASLGEVVVALDGPLGNSRACDDDLARRGVPQKGSDPSSLRMADLLPVGTFFETSVEGVFCALQGRRLPARRHPLGVQRRIEELEQDHVVDESGPLWERRIEELDAAAAALCAHRYAVGHACSVGDPEEGVVVLPGSSLPEEFTSRGVLPPVERIRLPAVSRA